MAPEAAAGSRERESARAHFDRFGGIYGRSRPLRRYQRAALAALELEPDDDFLDVGCGVGTAVREAAGTVRRAVGADLSAASIERGRAEAPGIELVVAEAAELPFGDGEFSAVLCSTSAHHHPDFRASAAELRRVLRPDGRAVIADFCRDPLPMRAVDALSRRFERGHVGFLGRRDLEDALRDAGLELRGWRTLDLGTYFVASAAPAGR